MEMCSTVKTPSMAKVSTDPSPSLDDPHSYRFLVGALQYLAFTRLDITFDVNQASQSAAKRILRLVVIPLEDPPQSSKQQPTVSRSSTEAEYQALATAASEVTWLQFLLKDPKVSIPEVPVAPCDNISTTYLAYNPVLHSSDQSLNTCVVHVFCPMIEKSHVLSVDVSSTGGKNSPFESPKPQFTPHRSPNHVVWLSDADPAAMDIVPASKQLWLASLGPDGSEVLIRTQFEKFGPIDQADRHYLLPICLYSIEVHRAESRPLNVPFIVPFTIASSRLENVENVAIRIELSNGCVGWDEAPILPFVTVKDQASALAKTDEVCEFLK
ncbi:hypothetical protein LIER_14886 [Lithospermum erythrorhizon]|uniref:Uncharacterized protein n=1 Tax=Lithospermum erythrorhizon TaxID=34254 RepID=A0AAV3Q2C4_LITER